MIVYRPKRVLIIKVRDTCRITSVIPTAKVIAHKGQQLVAVPHKLDEVRVLRNLGIMAPSPIKYYYKWSGQYVPFYAQEATAEFLTLNRNSFVLNDLGTGKTLASLWTYDYLRRLGRVHKALVISPLSTLERVWGDEIYTHFPHLNFAVLHGSSDRRLKLLRTGADVYLINHDGIKATGMLEALADRADIDLVIVDELAQVARTAGADRWKALNTLCNRQQPRQVWGLTGTPTPNSPTDAWAQVRIVNPSNVSPYFKRFKDQVQQQVGQFAWKDREDAMQVVYKAMQPAVRFTREDCVDLPPCIYQTYEVALTADQSKAYKEMVRHLFTEAAGGQVLAVNEAVKMGKLVQIACGVVYGTNKEEITIPATPRLELVRDLVQAAGTKVIVFVPFVSSVRVVADYLEQYLNPGKPAGEPNEYVRMIYGDVPKRERDEIFYDFQKEKLPYVLVAQPSAMSHGLTLTEASTIIWYAPTTSNDTYEQANGRITRPGQKNTQFIINIEGTPVERKMYTRLRNKQNMQGILLGMVETATHA